MISGALCYTTAMKKMSFVLLVGMLAVANCLVADNVPGVDRAFLDGLLRIPSQCGDEPQLARVVDYTRDWLAARGVHCTVETNDVGRVALYAATTPGKVHDYLFVSHLDVVVAPEVMFKPRYEGDKVFARGACDTKGNAAAMCQVLVNLVGKASVGMFLATDEDGGGRGIRTPQMMIDRGYLPRKMILVGDSAGEAPGQLFVAEKGHSRIQLVAHGKGGHASRPWALDNPLPKLMEGYHRFAAAWAAQETDTNTTWRTFVSPTMIEGSEAVNQIADKASLWFSCRYISVEDLDRVKRTMIETTGLEVHVPTGRLPLVNRPDDPEIARLLQAMKRDLPGGIVEGRMSAATDASYYVAAGVKTPIVIFAATGGEPHSDREWGSLSSLDDYTRFFTRYLSFRQ